MRFVATLTLLFSSLALALPAAAADSPEESAIAARQGHMHIRAFNISPLFAMLKGEMPYDANLADQLANNLSEMLDTDMSRAWMKGTSNEQYPEQTHALPGIWSSPDEFAQHRQDYADAVAKLASVAGQGFEAMAPAAKNVAQACKACHDDFREED